MFLAKAMDQSSMMMLWIVFLLALIVDGYIKGVLCSIYIFDMLFLLLSWCIVHWCRLGTWKWRINPKHASSMNFSLG